MSRRSPQRSTSPGRRRRGDRLFLNTNLSAPDEPGHNADGDSEPNVAAIKSLRYKAFSLPVEYRILLQQGLEVLSDLQRKVMYLFFNKDPSHTEIGRRFSLPQRKLSRTIAWAARNLKK